MTLSEGWYLMSVRDLELELRTWRGDRDVPGSHAQRLSVPDAIAYRNAGNLPDELGRTLRLVLHVRDEGDLRQLDAKRLLYEPDVHDPPHWRREGSRPVNVVPLRDASVLGDPKPWWEDPQVADLEREWSQSGTVAGLPIPGPYRSFVYKTVIALRASDRPVTVDTVVDSMSRWLDPPQVEEIRAALRAATSA